MEPKMTLDPPQHLNGSNNSGGFEPVQQQEMEVEETIGEWKEPEPVAFQQPPAAQPAPVVEAAPATPVWKCAEPEPEPVPAPAPTTPGTAGPPAARPERFSKEEEGPRNRILSTSDSQQLFVGNLPHNCNEEEL